MRTYLRQRVPGGTYVFTVNLMRRTGNRLLVEHIDLLRDAYRRTCAERPFETLAIVVLPEQLHAIWRLPEDDDDDPARRRLLKGRFSHALPGHGIASASHRRKEERGIRQRRSWEHTIRDGDDLQHHIDYIHRNPVKHGRCTRPREWPFSSLHRYIARGSIPANRGRGAEIGRLGRDRGGLNGAG